MWQGDVFCGVSPDRRVFSQVSDSSFPFMRGRPLSLLASFRSPEASRYTGEYGTRLPSYLRNFQSFRQFQACMPLEVRKSFHLCETTIRTRKIPDQGFCLATTPKGRPFSGPSRSRHSSLERRPLSGLPYHPPAIEPFGVSRR